LPPELARRLPLVGGADRAEDLERDADGRVDRLDAVDARWLEDPTLPLRVGGHALAHRVYDVDRLVDVGPEQDDDVLVDPGPGPGPVRGDRDRAVRDRVDDAVEVAQGRPPQAEVL